MVRSLVVHARVGAGRRVGTRITARVGLGLIGRSSVFSAALFSAVVSSLAAQAPHDRKHRIDGRQCVRLCPPER